MTLSSALLFPAGSLQTWPPHPWVAAIAPPASLIGPYAQSTDRLTFSRVRPITFKCGRGSWQHKGGQQPTAPRLLPQTWPLFLSWWVSSMHVTKSPVREPELTWIRHEANPTIVHFTLSKLEHTPTCSPLMVRGQATVNIWDSIQAPGTLKAEGSPLFLTM